MCCSEYQRYKLLKAIHNACVGFPREQRVAQNIKDTNFWKQFTTVKTTPHRFWKLLRISKIQTFESNSQLQIGCRTLSTSCSEYQRYKLLKAIHNKHQIPRTAMIVAQNIKDTNFWKQFTTFFSKMFLVFSCSEYQRYKLLKAIHNITQSQPKLRVVAQNIKDTNFWKQFTTAFEQQHYLIELLRISKIQTFESNSQLGNLG